MRKARPLLLALLTLAAPAAAYDNGNKSYTQTDTSIGGRATFFRPNDADHGLWAPGVQVRFHMNKGYSFELSADFTHHSIGQTTINVIPVQGTLIGYFYPESSFSPYLLTGIGWYYTKVRDNAPHTQNRWGPHAGIGLSYLTSDRWSIDGSYRYLWSQSYSLTDPAHPVGSHFGGRGFMFTLGLNYLL